MYPELNEKLESIAAKYGVSAGAAAAAFNLRIPGVGQAVIGSTKPARIRELAEAGSITLTHSEWYGYSLKIISAGGFQAVNRINKGLHSETRSIPTGR